MTHDEINTAIAEACGWTCVGQVEGCKPHGLHPMFKVENYSFEQVMKMEVTIGDIPSYTTNLNAMHEAEKALNDCEVKWGEFRHHLMHIIERTRHELHATARQRAEAFLKTFNLWEQ